MSRQQVSGEIFIKIIFVPMTLENRKRLRCKHIVVYTAIRVAGKSCIMGREEGMQCPNNSIIVEC